jgi:hypothetical protein
VFFALLGWLKMLKLVFLIVSMKWTTLDLY